MKVFFDTNVLISAHITRGLSADLFRLILAEHEFLTGEVNLLELRRILLARFRIPPEEVRRLERDLREEKIIPRPLNPSSVPLRDPDDAWVLASAEAGQADLLVTGDNDLLIVAPLVTLPILTPRACWERLRALK